MSFWLGCLIVLVIILLMLWDSKRRRLDNQAWECQRVQEDITRCKSDLDTCRGEVKSFEDGVAFTRLEAALKESNDQIEMLMKDLLLHKQMLTRSNEIADGYLNPSRTYTGISREFQELSKPGLWTSTVEQQKLNDRDAMIAHLRLDVQRRTAEVNSLMAELMDAKYGGTRQNRTRRNAAIQNWNGPQ